MEKAGAQRARHLYQIRDTGHPKCRMGTASIPGRKCKLTDGRITVRGSLAATYEETRRSKVAPKRADFVLYAKPNLPIAVIEVKAGEVLGWSRDAAGPLGIRRKLLDAPFALSSNGTSFLLHDRTGLTSSAETLKVTLDSFPSPGELWQLVPAMEKD